LVDLADSAGLTAALLAAMAPTKGRRRGYDRGQVVVDMAVMIAEGGEAISDLAVLGNQPSLFGDMASTPTAWRALAAIDDAALARIAEARAVGRAKVWAAGADPGFYVIDFDGTLITAHSVKEGAAPSYKRGFGYHPLRAFLDATDEALASILRAGNAGSNTTEDRVALLGMALAQLPVDPEQVEVIARADSAALTHGFIDACRAAKVRFSVGVDLTEPIRTACLAVAAQRWRPAITADGSDERQGAEVAEITDLVDLSRWPTGTRAICRREEPHPGGQVSFTDVDGHRFHVFITDLADDDITYLEAVQRGRGRAEKLICDAKATGLANLPSADMAMSAAWMTAALIAVDLLAWTRLVALDGDLARAEPKRLRYCLSRGGDHRPVRAANQAAPRLRLAMGGRPRRRLSPRPPAPTPNLTSTAAATGDHRRQHRAGYTEATHALPQHGPTPPRHTTHRLRKLRQRLTFLSTPY
jgi:hypothetical protein